jgi:hypothetical protein
MIRGETVTVIRPAVGGVDAFGDELTGWQPGVPVGNVLVAPAATDDLNGSLRRDGDRDALTLHFPKTFEGGLRGCRVIVRGVTYRVVGDPQRYTTAMTPGAWDLPVTVERTEG